jgi:hypothetical protein
MEIPTTYTRKSRNHNWDGEIIHDYVIPILKEFQAKGIKPTLRGMCYILESNKVIQKILDKCENRLGNIDFEKYKLYHNELEKYAIPLKDIEKIQGRPTANEIHQYQIGWGLI